MKKVSIGILIFIGALLITAFFIPRGYTVTNSETIAAPPDSVLHFMCMLGNQTRYNEWVMQDPDLNPTITGKDGTEGAVQSWDSETAGAGNQTIAQVTADKVVMNIVFIRPFPGGATVTNNIADAGDGKTILTATFETSSPWPMNLIGYTIGRSMIQSTQQQNLANVRQILENP